MICPIIGIIVLLSSCSNKPTVSDVDNAITSLKSCGSESSCQSHIDFIKSTEKSCKKDLMQDSNDEIHNVIIGNSDNAICFFRVKPRSAFRLQYDL